jgi:chemotaxis protein methyltransferase CheR
MAFDADSLGLQPAATPLLRDLVHERLGVYFPESRFEALIDRLAPLVADRGFASFLDYFYLLKYDTAAQREWDRVMDALSVPESYFWREIVQIQAVVRDVIPALARGPRAHLPIRISCVPCASGEEPLTVAMALEEEGLFDRLLIDLAGADASLAALARARAGVYRERAFRALPDRLRERYFRRCGDAWHVDPALHARVRVWRQMNLMSRIDAAVVAQSDVIFCRNVFIYFSHEAVKRVVNTFADGMPTPGYLCVGASESLLRITDRFELAEIGGAFMYIKQ